MSKQVTTRTQVNVLRLAVDSYILAQVESSCMPTVDGAMSLPKAEAFQGGELDGETYSARRIVGEQFGFSLKHGHLKGFQVPQTQAAA